MKLSTIPIITAPVDMSTTFTLPAVYVGNIVNYSVQLVFTGAPNGTLKLQFSSDMAPYVASTYMMQTGGVVNWTDCDDGEQKITESGDHMWNVQNTGVMWARVTYIATSGSGSLIDAKFTVKGV